MQGRSDIQRRPCSGRGHSAQRRSGRPPKGLDVAERIAAADPRLSFIGGQFGMFSMLPLSKDQVLKLRQDEAIYMADSGRFNVVGLSDDQIDRFTAAVVGALEA